MTDDDPLDLARVAADDAELERVRRSVHQDRLDLVGVDRDGDPAVLLLQDLLSDLGTALPEPLPLPGPRGSTILTVAGRRAPRRRLSRHGAVVAGVTAAVVSFGGVAAAGTLVSTTAPLHGLGQAVRSAAGAVVGAVSLPDPKPTPAARTAPASVTDPAASAAGRSQALAAQVGGLLDAAQRLLDAGRTSVASTRLDEAERLLAGVAPQDGGGLTRRLEQLRQDVQAATPARPGPGAPPAPGHEPQKASPPEKARQPAAPGRGLQPSRGQGRRGQTPREPAPGERPQQEGPRPVPGGQSSKDASTKPRA